jgi:predicted phage tail protein
MSSVFIKKVGKFFLKLLGKKALEKVEDKVVEKIEENNEAIEKELEVVDEAKEKIEEVSRTIEEIEREAKAVKELYSAYATRSVDVWHEFHEDVDAVKRYWDGQFHNLVRRVLNNTDIGPIKDELMSILGSYDRKKALRQAFFDKFCNELTDL